MSTSTYVLYLDSDKTEHTTTGRSPAKALTELVTAAGLELASQNGRYGKLTDGRSASAMTRNPGRAHYPDARTTRV